MVAMLPLEAVLLSSLEEWDEQEQPNCQALKKCYMLFIFFVMS